MIYLKTTHHWLSNVLQHIFIYTKSLLGNMRLLKKASHPKLLTKKNATRRFMTVTILSNQNLQYGNQVLKMESIYYIADKISLYTGHNTMCSISIV